MTTARTAAASATFSVEFFTRTGNALGGPVGSGPGSSSAGWTSVGVVQATQGATSSGVSLLFATPTIVITPGDTVGVAMLFILVPVHDVTSVQEHHRMKLIQILA